LAFFPIKIPTYGPAIAVASALLLLASCGGGGGDNSAPPPDPIPQGTLSVSGTIAVSPAVAVDMDTNDPAAPDNGVPDNDFPYHNAENCPGCGAQIIPNPGAVGGYLARRGRGKPGPARDSGDTQDFYRVALVPGQTISLVIADHLASNPLANDLDLLLLDLNGNVRDLAAGFGPIESLTIPEGGEYIVWVSLCADELLGGSSSICGDGATNYQLNVGQGAPESVPASLRLSSDFVTGEALVKFVKEPASEVDSGFNGQSINASAVADVPEKVGNVHLLKFEQAFVLEATASALSDDAAGNGAASVPVFKVPAEMRAKLATIGQIKTLARRDDVEIAEPNYIRHALFEPNDPGYQYQWHYPLINLPTAWDLFRPLPSESPMGLLGANVTVAVLDTGILPLHPDIDGQIDYVTGGYDFVSDIGNSRDGNGVDPDPTDPGDSSFFGFSSSFHGTHVAGTIAAATDNDTGVAGVAPDARILPIRVLGQFGGSSLDIRKGLCFAAGLSTGDNCDGVPLNSRPADIINLSLGGTGSSLLEQSLINELLDTGVIIVAAAGNNSSSEEFFPAAYDGVIGVGAVTIDQSRAPYSSYGHFVDIAGPGGDTSQNIDGDAYVDGVLSTGGDDAQGLIEYVYPFFQGTSMAAPHVAGVFALMRSVNSELTSSQIVGMLEAGELTIPLGDISNGGRNDDFGYGLIDANKAVSAAIAEDGSPPVPRPWLGVFPSALNYGATLESLNITLRNVSGGDLDIISIVSSEPWLKAPPLNGLNEYTVRIDRDLVDDFGSYTATLTITSSVNVVTVPVIKQNTEINLTGDAGHLYVRIIDTATGNIREVQTDAENGEYVWRVNRLPPGSYQLIAYTDADNDNSVCDAGEACGAYLTVDQPIFFDLTEEGGNLAGLDFQVSFGVSLSDPDESDKVP